MHSPFAEPQILALVLLGPMVTCGWTPLEVKQDRLLFMPGSQPGSVEIESATRCDNCHGGYNSAVEQAHNWRGSMMASAARDPLWLACLTSALQDSINVLGNPNVGDLCIRCHTPGGWLGGRSDPVNMTLLTGADFEGVNCDSCHKLLDANADLRQLNDLAAETDILALLAADTTFSRDLEVLGALTLFDGIPFFDAAGRLPVFFNDGALPYYIEATGGQFILDASRMMRGPRYDVNTRQHGWNYSRFHKANMLVARVMTCRTRCWAGC